MLTDEFTGSRMVIRLSESEREALIELARQQMRYPRDQVRLIVRKELVNQGLLKESDSEDKK